MTRLVRPRAAGGSDSYLDRVAKYIPVEIVGAFLAITRFISPTADDREIVFNAVFFILWSLTPVYIWRLSMPGQPWKLHAALSSAAFPIWVWAIAVPPVYERLHLASDYKASVALVLFSLVAGLFEPKQSVTPSAAAVS